MNDCKWWHKFFTVWKGEHKEEKTILSPDRPRHIVSWWNEYHCWVCKTNYRVDVKHNIPKWLDK